MSLSKNATSNSTTNRFLLLILALGMSSAFPLTVHAQQVNAGSSTTFRGPSGLTVLRNGEYNNVVSWNALSGAISYTLQHRSLLPFNLWTDVPGCNPTSTTCTD